MSETIKLCAMLARAVFENDDEAREPFVEQAMRAKREHDEMRRELAEARRAVDNIGDAYDRLVSAVVGGVASAAYCFDTSEYEKQAERLRADIEQADTTRREWEVRAATSYAAGRKVGLQAYDSGRWDGLCAAAELALNWGGASWNLSRAIRALANDGSVKLARMLDEAHATGRAAGLREAAAACVDVVRLDFPTGGTVENVVAMVVNRCMDRILAALAPPAAETVRDFVDGNPPKAERRNGTPAAEPRDEGES